MAEHAPMLFDFTKREALLMRRACHKADLGHTVSGDVSLAAVQRLQDAMLVTSKPAKGGKVTFRPTLLGREAWLNYGLRAAGRPLVRLSA